MTIVSDNNLSFLKKFGKLKKKKTGFILLSRHPAAAGCDVTIYTAHPRSLLLVDILTLSSAAGEETGSHDVFQTALADE